MQLTQLPDLEGLDLGRPRPSSRDGGPAARPDAAGSVSRRGFMKAGVGGAAVLGALGLTAGDATARMATLAEYPKNVNPLLTLVKRATQGFSLVDYAIAHGLGYQNWLEWQLHPNSIADTAIETKLAPFTTLTATPKKLYDDVQARTLPRSRIYLELGESTLHRAIYSNRQLFERMVEFWTNHFNVAQNDGAMSYMTTKWDRDVIRKHALGKFPDLLKATAKSGAMMYYLDNNTNRVGRPQENYARELLELHTVGVDNGYTQTDIQELAKALTGWTLYGARNARFGDFLFNVRAHDRTAKKVMTLLIPANQAGTADGDQVLAYLSTHRNTALYLAEKLAKWFIGETPQQWIINATAAEYMRTGGDIKAMLRAVLSYDAIVTATPKIRQPRGFVTSLVRSTQGTAPVGNNRGSLLQNLNLLGQAIHQWATPDGFPDTIEAWGQALHPRWKFASDYFDNRIRGARTDTAKLLSAINANQPGTQAWGIDLLLTGGTMRREETAIIQEFIDANRGSAAAIRDAFGLAASAPSTQLY